ncbi:enoyl-CoA hydratase/isomerase family protein, partial [Bacteroidota bacterium]
LKQRSTRQVDQNWHLATCKKPVIGAINGLAYGGGALMSSIFDIRIGCEKTRFRFLGAAYGRVNATWTLPLIVGLPMAKELLFTGRVVEAEEALRIGLLNKLVPSAQLLESAIEMGQTIAANNPTSVQGIKEILTQGIGMGWHERLLNEARMVSDALKPPLPRESFRDFLENKGNQPD